MAIFDIIKRKGMLSGEVLLKGLPAHEMYSVSVTFFRVASKSSPAPFDSDPPVDAWVDTVTVKESKQPDDMPLRFSFKHAAGYYYLGVGIIAYLRREGKMFAQVERFFPMAYPCEIPAGGEQQIQLSISWPDIPFEELGYYGTVYPQ